MKIQNRKHDVTKATWCMTTLKQHAVKNKTKKPQNEMQTNRSDNKAHLGIARVTGGRTGVWTTITNLTEIVKRCGHCLCALFFLSVFIFFKNDLRACLFCRINFLNWLEYCFVLFCFVVFFTGGFCYKAQCEHSLFFRVLPVQWKTQQLQDCWTVVKLFSTTVYFIWESLGDSEWILW